MSRSIFTILATLTLTLNPLAVSAQDPWLAPDKAKHFGATSAIAAGGYGLAVPATKRTRWRIVTGVGAGMSAAAAKELRDRAHGDPSWRDFAWGAAGTTAGVLIAHGIAKLWR